jgi:hypothetical protein
MKFSKRKKEAYHIGYKKYKWRFAWLPTRMTNGDILWLEGYNEEWEYVSKFGQLQGRQEFWELKSKKEIFTSSWN